MEKTLLNDPKIFPGDVVLESALGVAYPVYASLLSYLTSEKAGLLPEWHYYNDGKAWLCKVQFKKKTVFWLSVYDGFFMLTFYFMEKHIPDIMKLAVSQAVKDQLANSGNGGKLIPVTFEISKDSQLRDVRVVMDFKKTIL